MRLRWEKGDDAGRRGRKLHCSDLDAQAQLRELSVLNLLPLRVVFYIIMRGKVNERWALESVEVQTRFGQSL